MDFISLFSGVGGFDLGLERAGHRCILQAEQNEFRRKVLAKHWPDVPCLEDVRDLRIEPAKGSAPDGSGASPGAACRVHTGPVSADLICGGFPCQDLSNANGQRKGLAGERSGLFFEFMRIADELEPEWLLLENVPGLFSAPGKDRKGEDFQIVLDTLADIGFHRIAWRVLDSQHFGVPQRRRRVFILARRGDRGAHPLEVLLEPESVPGDPPESREAGTEVAGTLGGGSGRRGWCNDLDRSGAFIPTRANSLTSKRGRAGVDDNDAQGGHLLAFALRGREEGAVPEVHENGETVGALRASSGGSSRDYLGVSLSLATKPRMDATVETFIPSATEVRRLTPIECERLQGFPDNWTCTCEDQCSSLEPGCTMGHRYAAMGDAVTVPVIEWIGGRLERFG